MIARAINRQRDRVERPDAAGARSRTPELVKRGRDAAIACCGPIRLRSVGIERSF
jgi:hypothetical protein